MTRFTTTLATAAIGLTAAIGGLFLIPNAADASECVYGEGYQICFDITGQAGPYEQWDVTFRNNHTTENLTIVCDDETKSTIDWSSYGGLSQDEADTLADFFCSL